MKTGSASTVARGQAYEEAAEAYLLKQGLQRVARNYRCRGGEIDLIMRDRDTLAFVEVRYRASGSLVSPLETITPAKQRRIVRTAMMYLQTHRDLASRPCRFDAVAIVGDGDAQRIDWIKDAFSA
jgi:putative endonuclease